MADFPSELFLKPVISNWAGSALGDLLTNQTGSGFAGASALWPSANLAIYVPLAIQAPYLVRKVWWANGSAVNGNTDVGVYTAGGTLLFSSGATAQAGTSVIQSVTLGTPFLLTPGSYYLAMSASTGTTCQYFRAGISAIQGRNAGCGQQASAHALPATFTLASFAQTYMPVFGISNALVI